jgi:hypothetical protein
MVIRRFSWALLSLVLTATPVLAQTPVEPQLHHAPVSVAEAHTPVAIRAEIDHPELVRRALLVYRIGSEPSFREVEFLRASEGPYVAIIPEEQVQAPTLAYTIEIERVDGARVSVFASRQAPHGVSIPEDLTDMRERALYERLDGQRSVAKLSAEYVSFGKTDSFDPVTGEPRDVSDRYFRIEGSYTYRPMRIVTEFGVRGGTLRGSSPVPPRELAAGQSEDDRFDVGLDYGGPRVRFRFHDLVHADGELVVGLTELGFSWGGGGAILIGDAYGSKLTLGFESLQLFGTRFFSRMDVVAADGVILGPMIEVTNMPSAEKYGVRLLGEVMFELGYGFGVAVRGGYQARDATSGGPSVGATLAYAF